MADLKRIVEVCELIATDVEQDISTFDGRPFTGRTVGEQFGNQAAALKALATIVKELALLEQARPQANLPGRCANCAGCDCAAV